MTITHFLRKNHCQNCEARQNERFFPKTKENIAARLIELPRYFVAVLGEKTRFGAYKSLSETAFWVSSSFLWKSSYTSIQCTTCLACFIIQLSQVQRLLPFADHTAGDFLSGIAGRLGAEVIRMAVYDYCFSNNTMHSKPIRFYSQIRISLTPQ